MHRVSFSLMQLSLARNWESLSAVDCVYAILTLIYLWPVNNIEYSLYIYIYIYIYQTLTYIYTGHTYIYIYIYMVFQHGTWYKTWYSRERSSAPVHLVVVAIEKGSPSTMVASFTYIYIYIKQPSFKTRKKNRILIVLYECGYNKNV